MKHPFSKSVFIFAITSLIVSCGSTGGLILTPVENIDIETEVEEVDDDGIETTQIVKAILRKDVDASRVVLRDVKSYCGILLDDNNRKPICRLRFNRSQKYLGLMDKEKNEERIAIEKMDDIYDYADKLREIVAYYDSDE